ncbi:MAG: bifunctional adenosylcobinamide kinase/adenosylcobinamide-phosphate guanylyltransferase [Lachnospiraceae bacterium]|nr:bifunctional adenosylcobinamide kinase/adenosylcobinamide-phosphate guanylyltransferase [Lachnospiraceae bacterium]
MMILIVGRPDSGKSLKAEELAMDMSADDKRIYLATMIPYGEEGVIRVTKHKKLREGKGFVTVERTRDVGALSDVYGYINGVKASEATVLLECMANLCANVMFNDNDNDCKRLSEDDTLRYVVNDILMLKDKVKNLIVVTNEFISEDDFDHDTLSYINVMNRINRALARESDRIYDITEGTWKIYENDQEHDNCIFDVFKDTDAAL